MTILAHPNRCRVGERAALPELLSGREIRLSRVEPPFEMAGRTNRLPLADNQLSRQPIRLLPASEAGVVMLDCGRTETVVEVDGQGVDGMHHVMAEEVARGVVLLLNHRITLLLHLMPPSVKAEAAPSRLVGESHAMARVKQKIRQAAPLDVAVLLRGETGTGKELAARAIHDLGPRCAEPFVAVNMAAIPPTLAASELFGAARGAFTGADRKKTGFFGQAHRGTLFLDEIGDTPHEVQGLLLRALESGEIQPVGSAKTEMVDVRVITATDAEIESAVTDRRFRGPLYYRLAGYMIHLPALRERCDDIGRLLYHFLGEDLSGEDLETPERNGGKPWPPAGVVAHLVRYNWPGNVRELRNVARRLAIAYRTGEALGPLLDETFARHLSPPVVASSMTSVYPSTVATSSGVPAIRRRRFRKMSDVDEKELLATLVAHNWHVKPAATALGVSRATLYRLMEASSKVKKASELSREAIEEALEHCSRILTAAAARLEVSTEGLRLRMRVLGIE